MQTRIPFVALVSLVAAGSLAACSDDPVSYSEPVGISLSVSSGDIQNGGLAADKNVNTESGNPYAAFVAAARDRIGGDPGRIEVDTATLTLLPSSNNVDALGQVFGGDVDVAFVMNSSNTSYPVAMHTFDGTEDAGPLDFHVHFDPATVDDADYDELVGGQFKVAIAGDAASTFAGLNADANMQLDLTFTAYE